MKYRAEVWDQVKHLNITQFSGFYRTLSASLLLTVCTMTRERTRTKTQRLRELTSAYKQSENLKLLVVHYYKSGNSVKDTSQFQNLLYKQGKKEV
jgi:hypothetical protein